jgi:hypothetical protein
VTARLDEAGRLAGTSDTLEQADAILASARLAFTQIQAGILEGQLPATSPEPSIPQADWETLLGTVRAGIDAVRKATDAPTAETAYASAYSTYLRRILQAIGDRLADAAALAPNRIPAAQLVGVQADIQTANIQRTACLTALATHDLVTADQRYQQLQQTYARVLQAFQNVGQPMAAGGVNVVAAPDTVNPGTIARPAARTTAFAKVGPPTDRIRVTVADLDRQIGQGEQIVAAVAGVVAILLGLQLLWAPSPAWGSASDCIIAILWGLGLHQVAGAAMGQFSFDKVINSLTGSGNAQG